MMKFARIGGNSVKKASVNYDLYAKDRPFRPCEHQVPDSRRADRIMKRKLNIPDDPTQDNIRPCLDALNYTGEITVGNGGRKVRRGHVCDRAVENCGIFNNNERCTQIWKTGVRYAGGCWWKE